MSGGHWDYIQHQITQGLFEFGIDDRVIERFPLLSKALEDISKSLEPILHDIDWDFCCDAIIKNDKEFETDALNSLREAVK